MYDSYIYDGVCRKRKLYTKPGYCTLECSPKGTIKWQENQDWYGNILEPFALFIHDKKTSACYDPLRALNSLPHEFEIKQSTIPNAGLGAFAKMYIEQDTIFGPYKGIFEPDTDEAAVSGYSWKIDIREGEDRADIVWVDAKDVSLSNWVRYGNTPTKAEMENVVAFQYKGEMFYQAFKPIHPGTELFVWYGDSYGEFLGIEPFASPSYYYAKPGYVGGSCHEDDEGQPCLHDENTLCADKTCFCIPGTHIRAGMCIFDETLSGICAGSDEGTCKHDMNAECQRGVCVCKNNSSPADGVCVSDESFGGRCNGRNGQTCLLDENAECVRGLCRCKYGTSGIGGKCIKDETYQGRCVADDGEMCDEDQNAECWDGICVCKQNASAIDGKCELHEMVGGRCKVGDGKPCRLDENAMCIDGLCICKSGASLINGKCRIDGALQGMCLQGKCTGRNAACDLTSNTCMCKTTHFPYAGKCVKK
ncbi:uncharacterized protein LOC123525312 isoform X2 [Mercenaria mercenaria]|nr:uncharacterized protein LOC123525312 isoform X2 [Mercenaria mercenaria]